MVALLRLYEGYAYIILRGSEFLGAWVWFVGLKYNRYIPGMQD